MKHKLVYLLVSLALVSFGQVTADFTMSDNEGCVPMNIVFTNTSSGSGLTYSWNFGNGNVSDLQNPEANYGNVGTFTVTLSVSDGTSTDQISKEIHVYDNPVASFTPTNGYGCVGEEFTFTSTSTGAEIVTWAWDLKDGSYQPNENSITHSYSLSGIYDLSLEVTDINGCSDFIELLDIINISTPPSFYYTVSESNACEVPLVVEFEAVLNNTETPSYSYAWDFGDGSTASSANPSHTFTSFDFYNISLVVTDGNGCTSISSSPNVNISEIVSGFEVKVDGVIVEPGDTVCPNLPVQFINTSTGSGTVYWKNNGMNFASGNTVYNSFSKPGIQNITQEINSGSCSDSSNFYFYVDEVVANFGPDLDTVCSPYDVVQFTDSSINASSWLYVWGDGDSSYTQNPTHIFEVPYPVDDFDDIDYDYKLVVTNPRGCKDSLTYEINFNLPFAEFISDVEVGPAPLLVNFTNLSSHTTNFISYSWLIDGVEFSSSENPNHLFNEGGVYDVQLVVVTELGCLDTSIVRKIYVGGLLDPEDEEDDNCPGGI